MISRIYLAGPTVFYTDAKARGEALKALCARHGLEGRFPLDPVLDLTMGGEEAAMVIFRACCEEIRQCQGVVADLTPFRGPHADDGTAFELGMAHALGLPIAAYSSAHEPLIARVKAATTADGISRDAEGHEIENFGLSHNLMLIGAAGRIFASAEEAITQMASILTPPS